MSGEGAPDLPASDASGLRVAVVATQWHDEILGALVDGALRALKERGAPDPMLVRVPGSFELPVAAKRLADAGYDAVVTLGVIIRGGTPHFEYVAQAATIGLTQVATATGVPIGFGVLTCDNVAQAFERSGLPGSREDKGYEAAVAAVATALALRDIDSAR
jgi:6,7-dimethyl-8-ribityllumazine synthase